MKHIPLMFLLLTGLLVACSSDSDTDEPPSSDISEPLTAPAAVSDLTLTARQVKTLSFEWTDSATATYYQLYENPDGQSGYSPVGTAVNAGQGSLDYALAVPLWQRVTAQYYLAACNSGGCSNSATLSLSASELTTAIGYFKASNVGADNHFGSAVNLSADGTALAVGAYEEDGSGAVYLFSYDGTSWLQQAYIKASNTETNNYDYFGNAVSLSADGTILAVGAQYEAGGIGGIQTGTTINEGTASENSSGAVYLFGYDGTDWSQQAYIKASNVSASDRFARAVSLSADGTRLAVGAPYEDGGTASIQTDFSSGINEGTAAGDSGAVYLFGYDGTGWSQQAYIKASNVGASDYFGWALSLSADGTTLAVGARYEAGGEPGIQTGTTISEGTYTDYSGAVYLFGYDGTGWSQQAYIKASNVEIADQFGYAVSLSADGTTLAVNARSEDNGTAGIQTDFSDSGFSDSNTAGDSGAVYLFGYDGTSWSQQAYLKASNVDSSDYFGTTLSLSADGNTLAVGAYDEDGGEPGIQTDFSDSGFSDSNTASDSGAVYLFGYDGTGWHQEAYIKASNVDNLDYFGRALSLSADGNSLAVGAHYEDGGTAGIGADISAQGDDSASKSGALYLY